MSLWGIVEFDFQIQKLTDWRGSEWPYYFSSSWPLSHYQHPFQLPWNALTSILNVMLQFCSKSTTHCIWLRWNSNFYSKSDFGFWMGIHGHQFVFIAMFNCWFFGSLYKGLHSFIWEHTQQFSFSLITLSIALFHLATKFLSSFGIWISCFDKLLSVWSRCSSV